MTLTDDEKDVRGGGAREERDGRDTKCVLTVFLIALSCSSLFDLAFFDDCLDSFFFVFFSFSIKRIMNWN